VTLAAISLPSLTDRQTGEKLSDEKTDKTREHHVQNIYDYNNKTPSSNHSASGRVLLKTFVSL